DRILDVLDDLRPRHGLHVMGGDVGDEPALQAAPQRGLPGTGKEVPASGTDIYGRRGERRGGERGGGVHARLRHSRAGWSARRRTARLAGGLAIALVAVPGAHDVGVACMKIEVAAPALGIHRLDHPPDDAPLAHRTAAMRAPVVPSIELAVDPEHPNLGIAAGK